MEWTTACPDWAARLRAGGSIIPAPIYTDQAEQALAIFKQLRVVDIHGRPTFGECSERWVFDFVAAIFGAYDAETGKQLIREFYLLISKKNTKSTIAAGIMLTALILCWREEEEHLILAPTLEVAANSFKPAAAMVRADDELTALLHVQDHVRTITHRVNRNSLKVVAADTDAVSGKKAGRVLIDEHWVFGKRSNAESMFVEATGGQVSRDEGWVIYLSTQSDEPPAGVFQDKLRYFRDVRDGKISDRKSLPVLYEFPEDMVAEQAYLKPANFYITNPNIGRSVSAEWLEDQLRKVGEKPGSLQQFLAKHLNVEIGLNLRSDRWAGAEFWERRGNKALNLDEILRRSEVLTVGIDGGGLDDLLALAVIGREAGGKWLHWAHAWAHPLVLERRKEVAPRLLDFQRDGDLTIVAGLPDDVSELADIVQRLNETGLLASIGCDPAGIGTIVQAIVDRGIEQDRIVGISQGWRMNGAIKTAERKLAEGGIEHCGSALMAWSVGNAKVEPKGNAVSITKQAAGSAKIDPLMATFDAAELMARNPESMHGSTYFFDLNAEVAA